MRLISQVFAVCAALAALAAAPAAFAAGRGDVYSVSDVSVDVTAQDSSRAREVGFAAAQTQAFARLVKRLTLPEELARIGAPPVTTQQLDAVVDGVDIQQEGRSGVRYLARLAVNFDPVGVRKLLRDRGLTVVETRSAAILAVPTAEAPADLAAAWQQAWAQGGFAEELAPLMVAATPVSGAPDWAAVQGQAAAAGAASALYAALRVTPAEWAVEMTEVAANGARTERGRLSAPPPPAANAAATLAAFAQAVNDRVQNDWKLRLAAGAGQRARVAAVAAFGGLADWVRVKQALAQASATLVSDIQIEAVSKEGATLTFSHLGTDEQLAAELGRYGVSVEKTAQGMVLRAAGRS
ncbi:MAG: hypothetical protein AB7M12_05125 [Hyphomonadaceae bacterium]